MKVLPLTVLLFAALCAFIASPVRTAVSTGIELLWTDYFHGHEVSAVTGERWMGLFRTDAGFELAWTDVTVEMREDPIMDVPGEKTGKKVMIDREDKPVFLVKGVRNIKEGPVKTAFSGWEWLKPGHQVDMKLAGVKYTLSAPGEGEVIWQDYRVVLARGGVSQEIAAVESCCDDTMPTLIWAGDIDGDGAIDLYMDLSNHYNLSRLTLFLSSLAGEGELVGKAAEFVTTGC